MEEYLGEFMGTMVLVVLGIGLSASVNLKMRMQKELIGYISVSVGGLQLCLVSM